MNFVPGECEEKGMLSDCTLGSIESPLVTNSDENTGSSEVSQLWLRVQHKPAGLSEPCISSCSFIMLLPRLIFFLLVDRDYSNSNQNREGKAPQNTRGTKLYKG